MLTFKIALHRPAVRTKFAEAVHTDVLDNRKGYNPNFLNSNLPLPQVAGADQFKIAQLQQDIGPNGNKVLDYTHFSIVFNKEAKLPFYTAVNMFGKTNLLGMTHEERGSDPWYADARIKIEGDTFQYGNTDYKGSLLAKGHMVRYYDPAWGDPDIQKMAIGDTFHYTNSCPQIPYFNGVVWNYLEDYCAARNIFQDNKISVFAGPIFRKAETINGLLTPMSFWKIIVYEKDNKLSALGFLMSQEPYLSKLKPPKATLVEMRKMIPPNLTKADIVRLFEKKELVAAQIKISLIEEKTGLSFGLNEVDEYKGKSQYAARNINKPLNVNLKLEHFRQQIDTFEWTMFLKNL